MTLNRSQRNLALVLICGASALTLERGRAGGKDSHLPGMPGMNMGDNEIRNMGPSMAAMAGHMIMTAVLPKQPGDDEKVQAVIDQAKIAMERYQDYHKAVADGYAILHPDVKQAQFHFSNDANARQAEVSFDPAKPSALLYRRMPRQMYKLEGVMYTARLHETEEELNRRIPLSIARWHQHVNFCAAPADRIKDYFGAHPVFGMFGSINTKEACDSAHGEFYPFMFNWMIHVFPYEKDFKSIFSMNDDIAHVH